MNIEQLPVWILFEQIAGSIHMPIVYLVEGFQCNFITQLGVTVDGCKVAHWANCVHQFFLQRFWIKVFIIFNVHHMRNVHTTCSTFFVHVNTAQIISNLGWFFINWEGIINCFRPGRQGAGTQWFIFFLAGIQCKGIVMFSIRCCDQQITAY